MRRLLTPLLTLSIAAATAAAAQSPEVRARIDAYVKALSSGSPELFEAMARENFTAELLARSADSRKQMVDRIRGDFGALTITDETIARPGHVELTLKGATSDMPMRLILDVEATPPFKITQVGIQAGGPAGGRGGRGGPPPGPAAPVNGRMSAAEVSTALDGYLAGLAGSGEFGGVVLVAKDGKEIFQKAYGTADRASQAPMTRDLRFNIASIGKAFTRTAIGQLIAAGRLSESDTIGTLLPAYPNAAAKAATVGQLLNHRAGVADFFGDRFAAAPKAQFQTNHDYYAFVAPQPLRFPPGTRNEYCNGCYVVLGEIIATLSGVPYEQYIRDHVFAPAGITTAGFLAYGDPKVAPGYTRESPSDPWKPNTGMHGRHGSAAGGAFAAAADLFAFDNAIREQKLLDAKMTGWFFESPGGAGRAQAPYGIAGGAPGANASLESNGAWTVVVVGNLEPPNAVRIGRAIADALFGAR